MSSLVILSFNRFVSFWSACAWRSYSVIRRRRRREGYVGAVGVERSGVSVEKERRVDIVD